VKAIAVIGFAVSTVQAALTVLFFSFSSKLDPALYAALISLAGAGLVFFASSVIYLLVGIRDKIGPPRVETDKRS
jgi:hypothetical protein